jgi:predicted Fe-Mo cluster-binding NifX family protein
MATKIAMASDDGETVAADFRTARHYVVVTLENGEIVDRELRPKVAGAAPVPDTGPRDPNDRFAGHKVGPGPRSRHDEMAASVGDCEAVLAGAMSTGAMSALRGYGIEPVVTDVRDIAEAVEAYLAGLAP